MVGNFDRNKFENERAIFLVRDFDTQINELLIFSSNMAEFVGRFEPGVNESAIKSARIFERLSMERIENSVMRPAQISAIVVLRMYFVKVLSLSCETRRLIALFSFFCHSLIDAFSASVGFATSTGEGLPAAPVR